WNADEIDVIMVQNCKQVILCLVEVIKTKVKMFVSFVYASNSGAERREVWNDLNLHRSIVNNKAWVIMGDFNVTLKPAEHSNGPSSMTIDMNEYLDKQFDKANGVFLPYLVSDHSPAIMSIPKGIPKKKKSFRFTNYVTDKEEFFDIIKEGWRHEMRGCHMYKEKLNEAQDKLDYDPFNLANKHGAVNLLNDYTNAAEEELKLLHQKAKIQWLREEGEALDMIIEISDEEIKEALFDIDSSKTAGLDGFTSCFFKKAWGIIGNDICLAVKDSLGA
ncbi:RNA-directed DNA polymerase, eukaryota, reverse transcriptase zinc-binding domain protein, partial [Tanacetum coccineum]